MTCRLRIKRGTPYKHILGVDSGRVSPDAIVTLVSDVMLKKAANQPIWTSLTVPIDGSYIGHSFLLYINDTTKTLYMAESNGGAVYTNNRYNESIQPFIDLLCQTAHLEGPIFLNTVNPAAHWRILQEATRLAKASGKTDAGCGEYVQLCINAGVFKEWGSM